MLKEYPINETVSTFFDKFEETRYLSWDHCYKYFQNNIKNIALKNEELNEEVLDIASLHLGFYLASWGLISGSTFLLQSDYKIHKSLIENIIVNHEYKKLWDFDFSSNNEEIEAFLCLLFDKESGMINAIKKSYPDAKNSKGNDAIPSDTLTTKIIMGIFGCIPAYDGFFMKGLWYANNLNTFNSSFIQKLSKDSMKKLIDFYQENYMEWTNIKEDKSCNYPVMKLIDMYFWKIGIEKNPKKIF